MSIRGRTIFDLRWPDTPDFMEIGKTWNLDLSMILLSFVWKGYDLFYQDVLTQIDTQQTEEELERTVTQLIEPKISESMTGDEPFYVQHGSYEFETRKQSPAQPPQYDIAFVLSANQKIMWPLEAKVLRSDGAVAPYINDLKNEFLTCRYAPFSSEGAMLGYIFSGNPEKVFQNIERKVPCELTHHPDFLDRHQKFSNHTRSVPHNKSYPRHFRCHHLLLMMSRL